MPARNTPHEKLPHRLTQILARLNDGQTLDPRALAQEFGVSLAGIRGAVPGPDQRFPARAARQPGGIALLVKGHQYEALDTVQTRVSRQLEQAILRRERIGFRYRKDNRLITSVSKKFHLPFRQFSRNLVHEQHPL